MKIPVTLTDLSEIAVDGTATQRHSFRSEDAARRVLLVLKGEQARGGLELAAGADLTVTPRAVTLEAESFAAAKAAGYSIDDAALQAAWEQAVPVEVPVEPPVEAPVAPPAGG